MNLVLNPKKYSLQSDLTSADFDLTANLRMTPSSSTSCAGKRLFWLAWLYRRWRIWPQSRVRPWCVSAACPPSMTWCLKSRLMRWDPCYSYHSTSAIYDDPCQKMLQVLKFVIRVFQQFFMWLESNSPELSVPYLWAEDKTTSEALVLLPEHLFRETCWWLDVIFCVFLQLPLARLCISCCWSRLSDQIVFWPRQTSLCPGSWERASCPLLNSLWTWPIL